MPLALFDLDNTLADRAGAFGRWVAAFADRFNLPDDVAPWVLEADGDGFVPRPEFLAAVREQLQLGPTVRELIELYDATYPACYLRENESTLALQSLRDSGWSVGVVTNGRTSQQMEKMRRTGLDQVVDAVCVSEALGVRKPDRRIFEEAARQCSARLEGWMVGDSPAADVAGGRAAGLRTAWLARGRHWVTGPPPDIIVASITEAVGYLLAHEPR